MSLAKERSATQDSFMAAIQAYTYHHNKINNNVSTSDMHDEPAVFDHTAANPNSKLESSFGGYASYNQMVIEDGEVLEKAAAFGPSHPASDFSFISSINSPTEQEAHDDHSVINFKNRLDLWVYANGTSLLSFERGESAFVDASLGYSKMVHEEDYLTLVDATENRNECGYNNVNSKRGISSRLTKDLHSYEKSSSNGSGELKSANKDNQVCGDHERYGWLYSAADGHHESHNKRPNMQTGDAKTAKKQCVNETRKAKRKPAPPMDPQSVAAKQRRERISERLKILQDLVPNGSKVDLVTMLEKAISYVKFLQLQVKVLATDDFWPAQGGKAPEVARVKETIDAILSSHTSDTSSSSK